MTFDDVVSQPHITTTLRNQIISSKTAHAYLFTGSRGTGKTTCARIFAKAINCLNPKDGNPCLECDICKRMNDETLNDIIEIDAASNTGVDDMRELRESTIYTPEKCKYKVYIIDEVHMLSVNAFNALLKILEEPPEYVKFILATTEIHKVPVTIVSRCQRFDFRRILADDIRDRLLYIASQEGIGLDENAASLIAKLSDGGMRDALSLMDQCIAYSDNITLDTVSEAAGIAGRDYLFDLLDCFGSNNPAQAISIIDKLYSLSKDMQRLIDELISQMRNVMLAKSINDDSLFVCLPEEIERIRKTADRLSLERIFEMLRTLQDCCERLPRVSSKRIEIEMCMVKLCSSSQVKETASAKPTDSAELAEIGSRLFKLEKLMADGVKPKASKNTEVNEPAYEPLIPQKQSPISEPQVDMSKLKVEDFMPLDCWPDIIDRLMAIDPSTAGFLDKSTALIYENVLLIVVDNDFFLKMFKATDCGKNLAGVLRDYFGKSFVIRVKSAKNVSPEDTENPVNKLIRRANDNGIKVDISNQ